MNTPTVTLRVPTETIALARKAMRRSSTLSDFIREAMEAEALRRLAEQGQNPERRKTRVKKAA